MHGNVPCSHHYRVPVDHRSIGQRLRDERIARELSISLAARMSKVNRNLLSAIERGMLPSSAAPLERLAQTYGISLESNRDEENSGEGVKTPA